MNNEENQIMGIGLVQNVYIPSNRTRVYNSQTWNRYIYKGEHHISRQDLMVTEKNKIIVHILERILFYGYRHFKRGQGCSILSFDRIATCQNTQSVEKINYRCRKCGLPKKGHVCNKLIIQKVRENKKCKKCGKSKKGHICEAIKKDLHLLNIICNFFTDMF